MVETIFQMCSDLWYCVDLSFNLSYYPKGWACIYMYTVTEPA